MKEKKVRSRYSTTLKPRNPSDSYLWVRARLKNQKFTGYKRRG